MRPSLRRALCLTATTASLATMAGEARAEVRVTVSVMPPQPVAGQPFHVVYSLQVRNDRMVQATQLQFPGMRVLANAAPPSTANMMIGGFGAMGGMFSVQSSA